MNALVQYAAFLLDGDAAGQACRTLHGARLQRRKNSPRSSVMPGGAPALPADRRTAGSRRCVGRSMPAPSSSSAWSARCFSTPSCACNAFFPWFFPAYMTTPMTPDLAMNTAVSFATTTHLASLWRRNHAELLQPDRGPHGAELSGGRSGPGGGSRFRSWPGARSRRNHRQLLGRSGALHPVGAVAAVDCWRAGFWCGRACR